MSNSRTPVLVGVGQYTQRKNVASFLDPMGLMVKTSEMAINDTGKPQIKDAIDALYVVNLQSLTYEDAPGMLSQALGIDPAEKFYSGLGGNTPQKLVNRAAKAIASGKNKAVLITGGEAMYSLRRSIKGEISLAWPKPQSPKRIDEEEKGSVNEIEAAYGLVLPTIMYPFFDTALRGASGRDIESHRRYMGRICEHLSKVASQNPHSWSRKALSADELTVESPKNRYIAYPYTKQMVANMYVDQGAALVMTSEAVAEKLGIDPALWVYPMGGADLKDIWYVSRRPKLHEAPAIGIAAGTAMDQAGVELADIGFFDFYSCFPCAVEMGRKSVGLKEDDPRDLSVTGGLSYFGGAMNNYSMHAVVSTVDRIRKNPSLNALVTSLGWYMTKHSVVVYGKKPGRISWEEKPDDTLQQSVDAKALPDPVQKAEGQLTVEAYIVIHGRDGHPERGVVMGRLADGQRALADIKGDIKMLEKYEKVELVGSTGKVTFDPKLNLNIVSFSDPV
jgi:acetyl-CoA C-acetyltransferase